MAALCAKEEPAQKQKQAAPKPLIGSAWVNSNTKTTRAYCQMILNKVDGIVRKELYSEDLAKNVWPNALKEHKEEILASRNLAELSINMNKPIKALHSSHCQFATINDETFHFLHSLFSSFNRKMRQPDMDFTGMVLGGLNFASNQVRYVIDGSPAHAAGIRVGDLILAIDDNPYIGQENFFNKSGNIVKIKLERNKIVQTVDMTPVRKAAYRGYIDGTRKSARVEKTPSGEIGYIHIWAGGQWAHEALEETLEAKLLNTKGLILDMRDGYGGNGLEDLDFFYRPAMGYPIFTMTTRDGKKDVSQSYYDKPVVAIINGGARSGRELLAFSLKRSGRALLVGEKTSGSVLAGRLFPLDKRCSLYLAVADGTVGGVRLEGQGVAPNIEVANPDCSAAGYAAQLDKAKEELEKAIKKGNE